VGINQIRLIRRSRAPLKAGHFLSYQWTEECRQVTGLVLHVGLPIIAVDWSDEVEDLEGQGTAQYDRHKGWWVVEFDEFGVRYVPAGNRDPVKQFLCVHCRQCLPIDTSNGGFDPQGKCAFCGTSFTAAYAPPLGAT
jgi:hypothetical protein